ncbi:lysophospholipase [Mycoplasmatota bacterium WC44]
MIENSFLGSDGVKIFYDKYECENPKAILQIVHGSIEHSKRYGELAEYLKENGLTVYAADLRGHGRSLNNKLNYLSDDDNGWELYIEETKTMTELIKKEYPGKKIFIMGHSMGSFVVRDYLSKHSNLVDGAILSGTGSTPPITMKIAQRIIKSEMKKHGKDAYSKKLHKLIYGGLDKKVRKYNATSFMSRDENVVKKFNEDPLCGETITIDYAKEMSKGILYVEKKKCFNNVKNIPLYIFSGEKDPVGGRNCNSVKRIHKRYMRAGLEDTTIKIYPGALHEMINEINKEEAYGDISNWIEMKI